MPSPKNNDPLVMVPAQVMGMNPRLDRSWKLVFETRELTGDEVKVLADNFQGEGYLLFKPNKGIVDEEIPEGQAESGVKSQSRRLRDVIFIDWKQHGEKSDFESYYRTYLEKLIEYAKSRLTPEEV